MVSIHINDFQIVIADAYQDSSEHEEDKEIKRPAALQSFWVYWISIKILEDLYCIGHTV